MNTIATVVIILAAVCNILLIYIMVTDWRRWSKEQDEWHKRIQDNWLRFTAAAMKELNDRSDENQQP